ncbi:MAG: LPS export ABC transporter ATP-binding protein [Nitrospinota bacterium]
MKEILKAENLKKQYRGREVVKGVSLSIKRGETVGLLGPNGAGKTTTFYMVVGLTSPDSGTVFINEQEITRLPMFKRAKQGLGYLPQEASVFRKLTAKENILAVLEHTGLGKKEIEERCLSILEELKICHIMDSMAYTLSGGERRRVEIGRALALSPLFILLDEPFAGIDPIAVRDIQGIVNNLKNKGIGILITDHNVRETLEITDRTYIINEGSIIDVGAPEEIASSEKCRKFYLGEDFKL